MIPLADLTEIARDLAIDLELGEPLNRAVTELARAYPAHGDRLGAIAHHIEQGGALSEALAGWWPDHAVRAVRAGERAGTLPAVLTELHHAVLNQLHQRRAIGKLRIPAAYYLGALLALAGFILFLLPQLLEPFPARVRQAPFAAFILDARAQFDAYQWWILGGLGTAIVLALLHLSDARNREAAMEALMELPLFRDGYRQMGFALWARYTALLDGAGLGTIEALEATASLLPARDRAAIDRIRIDLERGLGLARAVAPPGVEKEAGDDPRNRLPRRITRALLRAATTGRLDQELSNVAKPLHELGEQRFLRVIGWLNTTGIVLTATTLAGCLVLYLLLTVSMLRSSL